MSSPIGWCDLTLNPGIYGCREVSPACTNCYAATMARRLDGMGQTQYAGVTRKGGGWNGKVRWDFARIKPAFGSLPKTDRVKACVGCEGFQYEGTICDRCGATADGEGRMRRSRRVFVTSMADLFHEDIPTEFVDNVFAEMRARPHLTFLVLTKRTERMATEGVEWADNIWAGTTVEDQTRAYERLPWLCRITGAGKRFISAEPLLGPLDISQWLHSSYLKNQEPEVVDWVISGSESGPQRRPTELGWVQSLRRQCAGGAADFYLKQLEVDGEVVARPKLDGRVYVEIPDAA